MRAGRIYFVVGLGLRMDRIGDKPMRSKVA